MKKCESFLKLYRDYFRSVFWCKERRFSEAEALLDLLAEARFDTVRVVQRMGGAEVLVGRGQLALTLRYLARRWQWSVHRVQLFLSLLRDMGYVELETHRQFHLLTVADLTDFGCFPFVRQEVTTPSARRRKAGRDASGGASAQPAGYSSGTPCGTKKKKEEKNKETSLTRGKERAEPSLGEGFGVLLAEGAMPPVSGDGRPPHAAGPTGARAECATGVPDGSATQDGGKRGDAECSRKAPDAGTALAHGRKQTGTDGVQDTASQGAESRRAGAECPPRGGRRAGRKSGVTGALKPGLDADYLDSRLAKPLAQCEADVVRQHQWLEVLAMNLHAAGFPGMNREVAAQRLNEFFRKLECEGVRYKSRKDAMHHFTNWLYKLRADEEERSLRRRRYMRPPMVGMVLEDNSPDRFRQEDLW